MVEGTRTLLKIAILSAAEQPGVGLTGSPGCPSSGPATVFQILSCAESVSLGGLPRGIFFLRKHDISRKNAGSVTTRESRCAPPDP